jgi:hypothetical protein
MGGIEQESARRPVATGAKSVGHLAVVLSAENHRAGKCGLGDSAPGMARGRHLSVVNPVAKKVGYKDP